jgi:hypothetical protein
MIAGRRAGGTHSRDRSPRRWAGLTLGDCAGRTRVGAIIGATLLLALIAGRDARAVGPNAVRDLPGFAANTLPANDDESTGSIPVGFPINFFGTLYESLFVNNNGNLTFDGPLSDFTPVDLIGTEHVIVAAFWADVDTQGAGSAPATYGNDLVDGRRAFGASWRGVGYYASHDDRLNHFQIVLIERADRAAGDFDIELNYDQILWDTGDVSDVSARAGFSNGTGVAGHSLELPGSGVTGAFFDGNPATALVQHSRVSTHIGRYVFEVHGGVVRCQADLECDDGLSCTVDRCQPGAAGADVAGCVHPSTCVGDPCSDAFCSPDTGTCVATPRADGSACDNGNDCGPDTCHGGVCQDHALCPATSVTPIAVGVSGHGSPPVLSVTFQSNSKAAKGDFCEAQAFAGPPPTPTAAGAPAELSGGVPQAEGAPITRKVRKPLKGKLGNARFKLKLNPVGKQLLRQVPVGQGIRAAVQFNVQLVGQRQTLLRRLVTLVRKK